MKDLNKDKLKLDNYFMDLAIKQAKKAYKLNEVPVGSIVVSEDNKIIGRGYNKTEKLNCQSKHAEIIAIEKACKNIGDWRLNGTTIYVTLEPCLMCFGLIGLSRIKRIVYGAESLLFGYHIDKDRLTDLYQKHIKDISKGIQENEINLLLKQFFKKQRNQNGG